MHLTENPAPTLSRTRSSWKKIYRPRALAKDHICVCGRNCNLSHKQAPSSNQNKPSQVKVKVTEQRSSPLKVPSFPCSSPDVSPQPCTSQNSIDFSENERPVRTAGLYPAFGNCEAFNMTQLPLAFGKSSPKCG